MVERDGNGGSGGTGLDEPQIPEEVMDDDSEDVINVMAEDADAGEDI